MLDGDGKLILDEHAWDALQDAQHIGNEVKWQDDKQTWGMVEAWRYPKQVSKRLVEDCDGIALYKLKLLCDSGIPDGPLLMTVVEVNGGGHAVLTVATDDGDWVLDNRYDQVMAARDLEREGYKFLYRSKLGSKLTDDWEMLF